MPNNPVERPPENLTQPRLSEFLSRSDMNRQFQQDFLAMHSSEDESMRINTSNIPGNSSSGADLSTLTHNKHNHRGYETTQHVFTFYGNTHTEQSGTSLRAAQPPNRLDALDGHAGVSSSGQPRSPALPPDPRTDIPPSSNDGTYPPRMSHRHWSPPSDAASLVSLLQQEVTQLQFNSALLELELDRSNRIINRVRAAALMLRFLPSEPVVPAVPPPSRDTPQRSSTWRAVWSFGLGRLAAVWQFFYAKVLGDGVASDRGSVDALPMADLCKVCMNSPVECAILECGHLATCQECGDRLINCPICRQPVYRVVRIYKS